MIASNLGQPAPSRCANRRVAVTGVGLCTSQLPNTREFYAALESEVSPLFRHQCGADEELSARFPQIKPKYLDETAKYAILASAEAFRNAGLRSSDEPPEGAGSDDIGLVVGTFSGPIKWGFENGFIEAAADWDNPGVSAASSVVAYYGSLIGNMTIPLRISGPSAVF